MFQSTPSGGKATIRHLQRFRHLEVSIHAFRGEGDPSLAPLVHRAAVSIHAFRGEGDNRAPNARACSRLFQSTPSGGKATARRCAVAQREWFQSTPSGGKATSQASFQSETRPVSIHAFRGEGDRESERVWRVKACFNPRLPGGRRPYQCPHCGAALAFQSTPSGGKATNGCRFSTLARTGFNPRLPGGRRPGAGHAHDAPAVVSIHAFRGEGDLTQRPEHPPSAPVSIHAFRGEGDCQTPI